MMPPRLIMLSLMKTIGSQWMYVGMMLISVFAAAVSVPSAFAQGDSTPPKAPLDYPVFLTTSLRDGLDTTISPCADFDQFVNGGWRATPVLPDSVKTFGVFQSTWYQTELFLGNILDSARRIAATTSDARLRLLGTYYESCLVADSLPRSVQKLSMHGALKHDSSRTARCRRLVMHQLPDALGQVFVETILTPDTQSHLDTLVEDIRASIVRRVVALPFLTADVRDRTLTFLRYMTFKIAKPADTIDYSGLVLSSKDFVANLRAIQEFTWKYRLLQQDGSQKVFWLGTQYTPNAHFNSINNSTEIPTILFQWPFFDPTIEPALSYAAAGVILGHEILHGVTWKLTSEGDASVFERAKILGPQYSALPPIDSVPINGYNTINENLADLGGVLVAYDAWSRRARATATPTIDGFTPEQRFFLHYARMWRSKPTRDFLTFQAGHDPHAPERARINGVVMNVPAFANAFHCHEGDPMVRSEAQRAKIW